MIPTKYAAEVDKSTTALDDEKKKRTISQSDWRRSLFHQASLVVQAKVEEKQAEKHLLETELDVLRRSYEEGHLDIARDEFDTLCERIATDHRKILFGLSIIHTNGGLIAGQITDDLYNQLRGPRIEVWRYVDLLAHRTQQQRPHGATLDLLHNARIRDDKTFSDDVVKRHGAKVDGDDYWCPITRKVHPKPMMAAAHIVKYNIGESTLDMLFGRSHTNGGRGHIQAPKNGLYMLKSLEAAWDAGRFAITPIENLDSKDSDPVVTFRVVVLDATLQSDLDKKYPSYSWCEPGFTLNGAELQFRTDFRPARRYLYFHFITTVLRRHRLGVPGSGLDIIGHPPEAARALWASPGSYLSNSIMYKLSRRAGLLTADQANKFWSLRKDPETLPPEDEMKAEDLSEYISDVLESGDGEGGVKDYLRGKGKYAALADSDDESEGQESEE